MSISKKYIAIISILLLQFGIVQAGTYYVSPTGSAAWSQCTNIDTPCSPEVSMANAVAGDTVYFRGGRYELYYDESKDPAYYWYRGILSPSNSGTSANPITFVAYPEEVPILNCHTTSQLDSGPQDMCRAFGNGDKNYIVFDGFTIYADNGTKMGGLIITGKNIGQRAVGNVVKNCVINGGSTVITSTDNREGIRLEETSNTLIQNCKLYNYRQTTDWHNTAAIKMYFNDNVTIEYLEIYNSSAGIYLKSDIDNSTFRYNYVHDSYSAIVGQVYTIRNSDNNKIYNNVLANNSFMGLGVIQNEDATADGWQVYNNTIYNSHYGIIAAKGKWKIWNNILMGNSNRSLRTYSGNILVESDHNQMSPLNNILRVYAADQSIYTTLTSWQNSGELEGGGNPGNGSLVADPKFVNSSGNMNQLDDFILAQDSPCKGAGRSGVDMGANIANVGYVPNRVVPKPPTPN